MGVTITKRGKEPKWNAKRAAQIIKAFVPGAILERTNAGIDMNGRAFAGYSTSWRETLALGGEDPKVDLRLSGGMMNSVKAREMIITATTATVITAPDTGTSPEVRPSLSATAFNRRASKADRAYNKLFDRVGESGDVGALASGARKHARSTTGRMKGTGRRGPAHNILAGYLHDGTAHMPPRPFLGLTKDEEKELVRLLLDSSLWE